MGLYLQRFDFGTESQVPDLSEIRREAISRLGSDAAIEGIEVRGAVVEVRTMMDPFAHLILPAILMERGGRPLEIGGGPTTLDIPEWAHGRLRDLPWLERFRIRHRWWSWLIGTARGPRRS